MSSINPYGLDSVKLIQQICEYIGIQVKVAEGLLPSSINNGGFPLANMSAREAIEWLTNRTWWA